jgi:hypothetical protein
MNQQKVIALTASIFLLCAVIAGIVISNKSGNGAKSASMFSKELTTVRGLIGSEKLDFFNDEKVVETFKNHGFSVIVEKAGSRQIATHPGLDSYDFAFPAGVPAAEQIKRDHKVTGVTQVFYTPMAICSWKIVAEVLEKNGIVQSRDGVSYIVDLKKLLSFAPKGVKWKDLQNSQNYPANKVALITSTDIRTSNSAAMFLALASYLFNDDQIVTTGEQIEKVVPDIISLFAQQGYVESSSAAPYEDYLVMGAGKSPLVLIYESQYLHDAIRADTPITNEMSLLYPEPTIFSKHIMVSFSPSGKQVAELLANDPVLQQLAAEFGFRTQNVAAFKDVVGRASFTVPYTLINVVDPPSYENLEKMIQIIEQSY